MCGTQLCKPGWFFFGLVLSIFLQNNITWFFVAAYACVYMCAYMYLCVCAHVRIYVLMHVCTRVPLAFPSSFICWHLGWFYSLPLETAVVNVGLQVSVVSWPDHSVCSSLAGLAPENDMLCPARQAAATRGQMSMRRATFCPGKKKRWISLQHRGTGISITPFRLQS